MLIVTERDEGHSVGYTIYFIWRGVEEAKGDHFLVNWIKADCTPMKYGGLGIKD